MQRAPSESGPAKTRFSHLRPHSSVPTCQILVVDLDFQKLKHILAVLEYKLHSAYTEACKYSTPKHNLRVLERHKQRTSASINVYLSLESSNQPGIAHQERHNLLDHSNTALPELTMFLDAFLEVSEPNGKSQSNSSHYRSSSAAPSTSNTTNTTSSEQSNSASASAKPSETAPATISQQPTRPSFLRSITAPSSTNSSTTSTPAPSPTFKFPFSSYFASKPLDPKVAAERQKAIQLAKEEAGAWGYGQP